MLQYKRNNKALSSKLQDEIVMMDIDRGKYFSLNPTATSIWELLEQPMSHESICEALMAEYDVDPGQCSSDVSEHLKEMVRLGLVVETREGRREE